MTEQSGPEQPGPQQTGAEPTSAVGRGATAPEDDSPYTSEGGRDPDPGAEPAPDVAEEYAESIPIDPTPDQIEHYLELAGDPDAVAGEQDA